MTDAVTSNSPLKIELVLPFVQGVTETFDTMIGIKVHRKDLFLKKGYRMYGEISGVIGLSGVTTGTCAVSLPSHFAMIAVGSMIGESIQGGLEQSVIHDGIGEIVNMVAGRAKALLSTTRYKFDITLPTIISGNQHEVFHRKGTHCIVILFEGDAGASFTLDLCVSAK